MPEPNIRKATKDDARSILETHYQAVHETAAADYPGEILDEWSATVDEARITAFLEKFADNKEGELILCGRSWRQDSGIRRHRPSQQ